MSGTIPILIILAVLFLYTTVGFSISNKDYRSLRWQIYNLYF